MASKVSETFRSASAKIAQNNLEIPGWLMSAGITGWLVVGIAAMVSLAGWLFVYSASISIPLLLAMVIGMVAYPLCERMTARGLPKAGAAVVVLLLLVGIIVGVIWVSVAGVISQWPNIQSQIQAGLDSVATQLQAWGFDTTAIRAGVEEAMSSAENAASSPSTLTGGALSSIGSALASGLSGLFDFFFGLFIAATLLYYFLTDFPTITAWIARHMGGLPVEVGEGIIEDAVSAMRGYFRGTTITGFVVATFIGLAMWIMGVPLAATVAIVTFFTCYIPFFGAIISGAFAFLVALGSNGMTTAIALLVIVLVAQNLLQTIINARVMGESLNLHPLVVLVVTMLGGIFGGLLGAMLGAPLAALLVNAGKRLSAALMPEITQEQFGRALEHAADEVG